MTADTPAACRAKFTAAIRSVSVAEPASTSRMLACGAMAWAHSTSSAISPAQPASVAGSCAPPLWFTTFRLGGALIPNC